MYQVELTDASCTYHFWQRDAVQKRHCLPLPWVELMGLLIHLCRISDLSTDLLLDQLQLLLRTLPIFNAAVIFIYLFIYFCFSR